MNFEYNKKNYNKKNVYTTNIPGLELKKTFPKSFSFKTSHFFVHVNGTFNNIFVTLTNNKGEVLLTLSGGKVGFKGPKKASGTCCFIVGSEISKKLLNIYNSLENKNYYNSMRVTILLKCPLTRRTRSAINGLTHHFKNYLSIIVNFNPAHNGVRASNPRRT